MNALTESSTPKRATNDQPILQINRLTYVKIITKILDSTDEKLRKYLLYAAEQMNTDITSGDVIDFALNMLFDRDAGFKSWHKQNK